MLECAPSLNGQLAIGMTKTERRVVVSLASLYAMRMLGLFIIMPVFTLYGAHLIGATPALMGLAIGVYGLTQAILQIPFGFLSDRIGRKPIIIIGLCFFAIGSMVAALSTTIYGVIAGRALQGAGAISATLMAMLADLTREDQRTKAMAAIGITIGLSFSAAMVLGPWLGKWVGLSGIFWVTCMMALLGIPIIKFAVPTPVTHYLHRDVGAVPAQMLSVLKDRELQRLNFGIFVVHFISTANFVVLPGLLEALLVREHHSWVYLPVLICSFLAMIPFIIVAEKKRLMKPIFVGAIGLLALSEISLAYGHSTLNKLVMVLFLFFMAFNLLEATLPSLVSKLSPAGFKGTAMGVYSCSQFIGISCGGALGGIVLQHYGANHVLLMGGSLAFVWLLVSLSMPKPKHVTSYVLKLHEEALRDPEALAKTLSAIAGVEEAVVVIEEQVAYLKVDNQIIDKDALRRYSLA